MIGCLVVVLVLGDWVAGFYHHTVKGTNRLSYSPSMTPPVAPKRTAAPVLCPRGSSGGMPCTIYSDTCLCGVRDRRGGRNGVGPTFFPDDLRTHHARSNKQTTYLERGEVDATEAEEPAQLPCGQHKVVVGHLKRANICMIRRVTTRSISIGPSNLPPYQHPPTVASSFSE